MSFSETLLALVGKKENEVLVHANMFLVKDDGLSL